MNFLNIGPWELMVILVIAILLVGPKRVVEIVQAIRRFAGQLRQMTGEFTSLIQTEAQAAEQEASEALSEIQGVEREGSESLEDTIKDGVASITSLQAELQTTAQETRQALEGFVKDELESAADIAAELQTTAEEAQEALKDTAEDKPTPEGEQDEGASD